MLNAHRFSRKSRIEKIKSLQIFITLVQYLFSCDYRAELICAADIVALNLENEASLRISIQCNAWCS